MTIFYLVLRQILRKTVTLDGDVVDPAGTMSGGSRNAGASLLTKLVELHRQRAELDAKEQRLAAVRRQEQQVRLGVSFRFCSATSTLFLFLFFSETISWKSRPASTAS